MPAAGTVREVRIVLTGETEQFVKSITLAGNASEKAKTKMDKMQSVGSGMKSLGHSMVTLAAPLVALGGYAVKTAANFQDSMTLIRTQAGASEAEVTSMSKAIMGLAPKVGAGPKELADALYFLESNGLRGKAALDALKASAVGAQVSGASLTDTANAVAGAMKAGLPDIHSASDAMAIMNGIVGSGKMKLTDLLDAMTTGILPAAAQMGLGMRDVGAELAAMTRQGIPAIDAATRLRMSLNQMAAPKGAATKALAAIGLDQYQLAHDLRAPNGLVTAMQDLRKHLQGASQDAQASAVSAIFGGAKSSSNVVAMLRALQDMGGIRKTLEGADSAKLAEAMGERAKDASFKWAQLKATAQTAMVGLGNALMPLVLKFLPKLVSLIKDASSWVSHLPKGVKEVVIGLTLFLAVGGPILMFLGSFISAISVVGGALTFLAANPIILFLAAIVVATVLVITHWKQVKQIATDVWTNVQRTAKGAADVIASVATGIYNALTWPFRRAWDFIQGVYRGITGTIGSVVHGAGSILHTATFGLLHAGGPVKRTHFDTGGPVGTDTIPGWLTPGEFVLNRATTARVGMPALNALNNGGSLGGGGNITIEPGVAVFKVDGRTLAEATVRYTVKRAARGSSSLVGGSLLMGSV